VTTIITREIGASPKGSPLTNSEVDQNFINLNTDKAEKASPTFTGSVTLPNSLIPLTSSSYPTIRPTLNLDFANSKTVDPRITFVRNNTATYYDGQTTAMAEQNLLLQSKFVASWTPLNSTLTANSVVAPDGTTTAATLIPNTTSNTHTVYQTYSSVISGATYVLSVYLKASGYNYAILQTQFGGINVYYSFNISTGTLGTINGGATPTITSVGNGWYRCSIVLPVTISTTSNPITFWSMSTDSVAAFVGDGTSGMQIWGAQLEQRSEVTAYTPTTTAAITNYIPKLMTAPAGVPRLDYNPTTSEALGLLIEESRTNLLTYSSDFSNAAWVKSNTTVTANATTAPDGTITANTWIENAATSQKYIRTSLGTVVAGTYTMSCFVKAALGTRYFVMEFYDGTLPISYRSFFNISSGTVTFNYNGAIGSIVPYGNGWYRCIMTTTVTNTVSSYFYISSYSTSVANYIGDGYSGIYIWGAQLEAGAFSTSYIPTVASTVTRAADAASMTGTNFSSWYNQSQGTVYAEYDYSSSTNTIAKATAFGPTVSGSYAAICANGGGQTGWYANGLSIGSGIAGGATNKQIISYQSVNFSGSLNGNTVATSSLSDYKGSSTALYIGQRDNGQQIDGHIRKLSYYPVALSSSNLVALTS